ncbi:hypothetical protein B0H19DRAFT_1123694, partial [Mycena capillaripes]
VLFVLIRFFFPLVLLPSFVSVSVLCFRYFCGILWMGFFFSVFALPSFFTLGLRLLRLALCVYAPPLCRRA